MVCRSSGRAGWVSLPLCGWFCRSALRYACASAFTGELYVIICAHCYSHYETQLERRSHDSFETCFVRPRPHYVRNIACAVAMITLIVLRHVIPTYISKCFLNISWASTCAIEVHMGQFAHTQHSLCVAVTPLCVACSCRTQRACLLRCDCSCFSCEL